MKTILVHLQSFIMVAVKTLPQLWLVYALLVFEFIIHGLVPDVSF